MATNVLFIVEGEKRERALVNNLIIRMFAENNIHIELFSVCGNIHMLYQKIIEMDGFANIRDLLLTLNGVSAKDKQLLSSDIKFAYTYLIFDFDPQNYHTSSQEQLRCSLTDVEEMLNYFTDETDGTIGKLYINYPMVESYRDHNNDLVDYLHRTVSLKDCRNYKYIVGKRGTNKNFSKYTDADISTLLQLNLMKAGYLISNKLHFSYQEYLNEMNQLAIFKAERNELLKNKLISILNTSILLPLDYRGKAYFEHIMKNQE